MNVTTDQGGDVDVCWSGGVEPGTGGGFVGRAGGGAVTREAREEGPASDWRGGGRRIVMPYVCCRRNWAVDRGTLGTMGPGTYSRSTGVW